MTTQDFINAYFDSTATFVPLDANHTLVVGQQNDWENRPAEAFVIPNSFESLETPLNSLFAQYEEDYAEIDDPLVPFLQENLEEVFNILFSNHPDFKFFYITEDNSKNEILALQNKLETMYPASAQNIAKAFANLF